VTAHLWSFLVLSAILIVVPGPDMALAARNGRAEARDRAPVTFLKELLQQPGVVLG